MCHDMARKTRVSFIRGMMVVAAIRELMSDLRQIFDAESTGTGIKTSTTKAKHTPRTASHKPAKKATTHGFLLNMARVRKKKRRDVNVRTTE